jgi:RNA polymerase sigma-70 factor (ECF subfamily)
VRAYAWRRQADIADDVVAETFLVAWRRLDQVPDGGELPWLLGVARKVRLNLRRGDRRRSALADRLQPVAAAGPAADPPDGRLARALGELAERDREILLLDAWEGLDNAAIARVLRCSRATVAVRKSRARRRLQALLADRPTNDPNLSRTAIGGTPDVR